MNVLHWLKIIKSYLNEKRTKERLNPSNCRPWPTDAAAWDLETLGANRGHCATNLPLLFKGSAGSFFYSFAWWWSLKMCFLGKVCLWPFSFLFFTSNLFGILLLKPGAGNHIGCHMIFRASISDGFYSSLVLALQQLCMWLVSSTGS